jgi:hypothetical protein
MFDIQELVTKFNPLDICIYLMITYMIVICYTMLLLGMVSDSNKWKFYIYIILMLCAMYAAYHFKHIIQEYISIFYDRVRGII